MHRKSYEEMYKNEDSHWWFVGRKAIIKNVLNKYVYGKKIKVLEVGCGSGGNLEMLSAYGEIFATELDDEARQVANERNICQVKKGKLPDRIPFDDKFDLICMLDVLEHIEDDLAVLNLLKDKLTLNGKLLITVPAYKFLWGDHDIAVHHKRRYTKKQLAGLAFNSGLKVEYITYFNVFLFPVIAVIRVFSKIMKRRGGNEINQPPVFVNNVLTKIFSSETVFLPKIVFPFGVSVLLIADNTNSNET